MAQKGLFPVSRDRHEHKFWHPFTSYDFARHVTRCTVVATEVQQTAAAFPIVFQDAEGIQPVAVFSLFTEQENPFVGTDGSWRAGYVPSEFRCFPFCYVPSPEVKREPYGHFSLLVNEASGLVSDGPGGFRFFDETGRLDQKLREVCAFIRARSAALAQTRELCEVMADMDLLEPMASDDPWPAIPSSFQVKKARLQTLRTSQLTTLAANGALRLIHAHQVSCAHFAWLYQLQTGGAKVAKRHKKKLSSFLTAMAEDVDATVQPSGALHACL